MNAITQTQFDLNGELNKHLFQSLLARSLPETFVMDVFMADVEEENGGRIVCRCWSHKSRKAVQGAKRTIAEIAQQAAAFFGLPVTLMVHPEPEIVETDSPQTESGEAGVSLDSGAGDAA